MRDPVPAIIEATATGEIAEIFGDIRRVLGVDVVNLIWRHLATIDGALAWTWSTLRPVYEDGTIAAEAAALHAALDLPALPGIPAEAFVALGLGGDDISAIRDTLAAYDRTNAMALIALSALLSVLGEAPSLPDAIPPPDDVIREDQQPKISLPRLLTLADLPTETAALIMTLNRLGTRRPGLSLPVCIGIWHIGRPIWRWFGPSSRRWMPMGDLSDRLSRHERGPVLGHCASRRGCAARSPCRQIGWV